MSSVTLPIALCSATGPDYSGEFLPGNGAHSIERKKETVSKKPNIVVVIPEQWRGDMVGCAGHPVVQTPNLDALSEEGLYLNQAFTTNPICTPSRCSLFTGWYPHTRGHRTQRYLLQPEEPNLLKCLRNEGYRVGYFGKNDLLSEEAASESVDVCVSPGLEAETGWKPDLNDPNVYSFVQGKVRGAVGEHADDPSVRLARRFISEVPRDRPYAVFLAWGFVHPPYRAHDPWYSMYSPDDAGYLSSPELPGKPKFYHLLREYHKLDEADPDIARQQRAIYAAMISEADDLLGQFVSWLREEGEWDDTAFFLVSDHGNYAGQYGLPTKWWTGMEDALTHVPMYAHVPGCSAMGVSDALVQHMDIFATILELAGIETTWTHFSRSLLPLLNGRTGEHRSEVLAMSGCNRPHESALQLDRSFLDKPLPPGAIYRPWREVLARHPDAACQTFMLRDNKWKYIHRTQDVCELYDVRDDPHEERNLLCHATREAEATAGEMRLKLLDAIAHTVDTTPRDTADAGGFVPVVSPELRGFAR